MQSLPFERHLTAMQDFPMCHDCQQEYDAPVDRRFYAQTTSCSDCGVQMEIYDANGERPGVVNEEIISFAILQLHAGSILAVKGIGGFLLMVDASNETAIQTLRKRKHRPAKPFAILYPSMSALEADTKLTNSIRLALQSNQSPIVLVSISEKQHANLATEVLAPGLDKLGVMLPYAPLLELLANGFGKPLVATSANISGSPILFENNTALQGLKGIADFILVHNRLIVAPQDDSVVSFSSQNNIPILVRRSRGWAPAFPHYTFTKEETILATGALLKSSFALAHQQQVYISQYLGNTESFEAQQAYRHTLHNLQLLLQATPSVLLTDNHPQYFSHEISNEIAASLQIPCVYIQHHKAHFAAILGEYGLQKNATPVLGVVWDGTGLGDDGNSWGGEFFVYENNQINRFQHFQYFPYLLGDKMAKEPRLAALSLLHHCGVVYDEMQEKFTETEWKLYQKMLENYDGIMTSSAGRLFDAVACIILDIDKQSYEGEAAMLLEVHSRRWCDVH
jgi:hydrogenase maturation protein HypF